MVGAELRLRQLERRLVQLDGLGDAAGGVVGRGEVVAAGERVGVVGAELRLLQLERRLVQRDRLGGAAGGAVGLGEVVAAGERVGVVGAELRLRSLSVASCSLIASAVRPAVEVGIGEVVAAVERVGVVGAELRPAQLQGALVLPDRQRGLAQVRVGRPQRVADVRLDDRLILERPGDLRLGGVDRLADRHVLAQAALLALGSGGREDVVLEEAQHGLGPLPRSSDCASASSVGLLRLGRLGQRRLGLVLRLGGRRCWPAFNSAVGPGLHGRHGGQPDQRRPAAPPPPPPTAVRFRRAHRRARSRSGSRQAVTGSSASQCSTSSASASAVG